VDLVTLFRLETSSYLTIFFWIILDRIFLYVDFVITDASLLTKWKSLIWLFIAVPVDGRTLDLISQHALPLILIIFYKYCVNNCYFHYIFPRQNHVTADMWVFFETDFFLIALVNLSETFIKDAAFLNFPKLC
jgi:hypothetical protein